MTHNNSNQFNDIKGKNILITGGSTGIGRATAKLLASQGSNVMIVARNSQHLNDAIEEIRQQASDIKCTTFKADVSKPDEVEKMFEEFDSKFGNMDVLINNAAVSYQSVLDGSHSDREYALTTNVGGYFACANEAAKRMKESGFGHIINIGSMSADGREQGSSVYVATKSAIQGFSEALRKELNPERIKVTLIEPGATSSDMQDGSPEEQKKKVEKGEMLAAEDIAAAVVYSLTQPYQCNVTVVQVKPFLQII